MKNISGDKIRCLCAKCKNKKFHHKDVVKMYLLKQRFIKKYLRWFANEKPCVLYKIMEEMMIDSTFNSSNIHRKFLSIFLIFLLPLISFHLNIYK